MGFLDFLNSFTSSAASVQAQIAAVFNFLLNAIIVLFTFIYRLLVDVANFLYGILQKVGKFFRHIWDGFFKGVFNKVFTGILKAHDWLESHLRPIIQFLQKIRAYVDRIFKLYVKPFINLIQHVRRVLLVLRLFHIKFAQKLDQRLLQIEVKVAAIFIEARAWLNQIIDVVNIIVDPGRLLHRIPLIISMHRVAHVVFRTVTGVPFSYFVGESFAPETTNPLVSKGSKECDDQPDMLPSDILQSQAPLMPVFGFADGSVEPDPSDLDALTPAFGMTDAFVSTHKCTTDTRVLDFLLEEVVRIGPVILLTDVDVIGLLLPSLGGGL